MLGENVPFLEKDVVNDIDRDLNKIRLLKPETYDKMLNDIASSSE